MMHAYDKNYLAHAQTVLGRMLDFAVYDLGYDIVKFFDLFLISGIAEDFSKGDVTLLAGKSGVEIAWDVLERTEGRPKYRKPNYPADRSEEYWTGWALAYYQWETSLDFEEISRYIRISDIQELYSPYHEMDIRQFVGKMNEQYRIAKPEANLKLYRQKAGFSQKELAQFSGVPLRTIQQYEQRQKNINKAQVEYLFKLSQALCCEPDVLIERVE